METLIFSQAAVFRLQQLASQYYSCTGERHRLGTEEGIISLLRVSAPCSDRKVRDCYDGFIEELNERQIHTLAAHGITLRQPLQVPLTTPIHQTM